MGRPGLSKHPKFRRLAQVLGSTALARGHLELLWEVAYENGDPAIGDPVAVEACAEWRGDAGKLFEALRDAGGPGRAGFIEARGDVWEVHDLYDHAPDYVRKRARREAERRTTGRTLAAEVRSLTGQGPPNGSHCPPNGTPPAPAPAPAPAPGREDLAAGAAGPVEAPKQPQKPRQRAPAPVRATNGAPELVLEAQTPHAPDRARQRLIDAMWQKFMELRGGQKYDPSSRDFRALDGLRKRQDDEEILRRWERGLRAQFKARCDSIVDLEQRWNANATPEKGGAVAPGPQTKWANTSGHCELCNAAPGEKHEEWCTMGRRTA